MAPIIEKDDLRFLVLTDGKTGHKRQVDGFLNALTKIKSVDLVELDVMSFGYGEVLSGKGLVSLQDRQYIVGAGHSTHLKMLLLGWRLRAKTLVIMKPSIPRILFDFCFIPEHDNVGLAKNTFITVGAMNNLKPDAQKNDRVLLLLGGCSSEYFWDFETVTHQIQAIIASESHEVNILGSRRTPKDFINYLRNEINNVKSQVNICSHDEVDSNWLSNNLPLAKRVWVTEDSVNMIYESLSVGAVVNIIKLPSRKKGRVHLGVKKLIDAGSVGTLDSMSSKITILQEADRAADWFITNEK